MSQDGWTVLAEVKRVIGEQYWSSYKAISHDDLYQMVGDDFIELIALLQEGKYLGPRAPLLEHLEPEYSTSSTGGDIVRHKLLEIDGYKILPKASRISPPVQHREPGDADSERRFDILIASCLGLPSR